jgi:hypothetical protein
MPTEHSSEVKLDIGHVLIIDIVGYSKGLINEQNEALQKLKEIVRGTEQVRVAEAEGKLLRLPTGDGGAAKQQYVNSIAFVTIYLGLRDKDKALDWLEKSYENQESFCWLLKVIRFTTACGTSRASGRC